MRKYSQVSTGLWRPDDDFHGLGMAGQWAYFMLITQPDISAAGVLSLNVKRWASRTDDIDPSIVVAALQRLQDAGKVVYDTDTEELLVRTFVKWDGGYNNQKRRPVIERAARAVESMKLRRVLARELSKLGLPTDWVGLGDDASDTAAGFSAVDSEGSGSEPTQVPAKTRYVETFSQVDSLSDGASDAVSDATCRFEGVVVTEAVVVQPQPSTPQPIPPSAAASVPDVAPDGLFATPPPPRTKPHPNHHPPNPPIGIARWWIDLRKNANTPVVAGGKNGPLHPVRSLVEQFTPHYTDDEIREALTRIDKGLPAKDTLDTTLARMRRSQQPRQPALPAGYEPRGTIAHSNHQGPSRESAQARKFREWNEIGAELDRQYAENGGRL